MRERCVRIVIALEVEQRVEQCAPLTLRDADREQDQNREVRRLFDFDTATVQIGSDQRRRNASLIEPALVCDTWRDDGDLDRIEHAIAILEIAETVPGFSRVQHPAVGLGCEPLRRRILEWDLLAAMRTDDAFRIPCLEEPLALLRKLSMHAT